MFSGNDSTESQNYTQWPLSASAYQSMQNEQVDWAALAHQWIKMKEAGPPLPDKTPTAPPPPVISATSPTKGEAPMDMENDSDSNNMGSDSNDALQWTPQQARNWNSWSSNTWPPAISSAPINKAPLLPTPTYNAFSSNVKEDTNFSATPAQNPGYWSGNGSPSKTSSSAPRIMKPHNKRFSKVNVPLKTAPQAPHIGPNAGATTTSTGEASPPIIDANKRKQLPAWIREGLEKMERDKLKQIDKYRQKDKSDEIEVEKKKLRENALEILKSTARENEKSSKPFGEYGDGSPSNDSGEDDQQPPTPPHITQPSATPALTQEELMLKVRRMMTEILLKVTNREILQICKEEHQRHVRKLKANDQRVSAPSAGANLSARLGLGAYGSGESSDDSGGEDEKTEIDSDNELKETIRRRKVEFEKVERAIQNRLAQVEAEKEGESNKDRRVSPESDGGSKQTPEQTQDRRSRTPKSTKRGSKRSVQTSSNSRSTTSSSSSSSSSDRRYSSRRSSRDRRRRSPSPSKRRSGRRKHSRSRSRSASRSRTSRSYRSDRRRDSRSSRRSRSRSLSRSRRRSRRRTRSRTRSRSRDAGRGRVGAP